MKYATYLEDPDIISINTKDHSKTSGIQEPPRLIAVVVGFMTGQVSSNSHDNNARGGIRNAGTFVVLPRNVRPNDFQRLYEQVPVYLAV